MKEWMRRHLRGWLTGTAMIVGAWMIHPGLGIMTGAAIGFLLWLATAE